MDPKSPASSAVSRPPNEGASLSPDEWQPPPVWGLPPPYPRTGSGIEDAPRRLVACFREHLDAARDIDVLVALAAAHVEKLPRGETGIEIRAVEIVSRLTARAAAELERLVLDMIRTAADTLPLLGATTGGGEAP